MADLDRATLLSALANIADGDDGTAAGAGRTATAVLADAGLDWSDVIVSQEALAALGPQTADDTVAEEAAAEDSADVGSAATKDEALALVDRLLARQSLFEGTREELKATREDILSGQFDDSDLAYLNALYARTTKEDAKGSD